MSRKVTIILLLALIFAFVSKVPAQEIDSFMVVDSICFAEEDSIWPVGVDGYGDYLWFRDYASDSGYRIDLSGAIISSCPLPRYGGHASAFYVDADYVYYGPLIDRFMADPSWSVQSSGTSNTLTGVYFVDQNNGWAVGTFGTIVHTSDGGNNWAPQSSGTSDHLYGVWFADANNGWAVGPVEKVLRTNDGGITWNIQTVGGLTWFESVCFVDVNTGWAVGGGGKIIHTTDGGATWTFQTSGTSDILYSVCFAGADSGWAVGEDGTIIGTTDGGSSWNAQSSGTFNDLFGVHFPYSTRGWAVGAGGTILRTWDGGSNWSAQSSGILDALLGVHFISSGRGWAVGEHGRILRTTDGGSSWVPQSSGVTSVLLSVFFVDSYTGWAVGGSGTILHASDGLHYVYGIIKYDWDWNVLDTLHMPPVPLDDTLGYRSEDIGFDGTRWWVGGRYGNIYSWAPPETTLTLEFYHAVSDSGHHLDGLEAVGNWIYVAEMYTDTIYQYDQAGNLIRKYFYSGEGGATYVEGMGFDPRGHLWYASWISTYCIYELGGIQLGEEICDFFLTPNKLNVTRSAEHTFMIHLDSCEPMDVSKDDSAEVYVDVDASCTFDSDERYPAVVNSPSMVIKVYCSDLVDNDPKVLVRSVNSILVADTLGYQIIMYLDTFTPPGKGPKFSASPDQFALGQNHPNPFNPITEFSINVPNQTHVSVAIYNVAGQKVKTLVDGQMDAGVHIIRWDGENDRGEAVSSGIYFCRAVAGEDVATRKMMLLK